MADADSKDYFKKLSNKTISITDVINGIDTYINDYLKGAITEKKNVIVSDQAGTTTVTIPQTAVTNGGTPTRGWDTHISWSGTINDNITSEIKKKTNEFLKKHKNKEIVADDFYTLIVECLQLACKIYYQYYVYYYDTSYKNSKYYWPTTVRSSFYRGVNGKEHVSLDEYTAEADKKRPESLSSGKIISTVDLDKFIISLIRYNESKEKVVAANGGNRINWCYSSCHSECHGSSRGRR